MMKLTGKKILEHLADFPNWEFEDDAIHTVIEFENFKEVFATMTRIAFEAEEQNHHPNWSNVYNELSISLSTHDAGGVTAKDFKLAQSIEEILGN
jgi:4a-hydroxytetrahydrobiopterin dehydratase